MRDIISSCGGASSVEVQGEVGRRELKLAGPTLQIGNLKIFSLSGPRVRIRLRTTPCDRVVRLRFEQLSSGAGSVLAIAVSCGCIEREDRSHGEKGDYAWFCGAGASRPLVWPRGIQSCHNVARLGPAIGPRKRAGGIRDQPG